jgi:hypothetical protein
MTGVFVLALLVQGADAEVAAAIAKTRAADRYAFKIETTLQGENTNGLAVEGRYHKDRPVWMKSGELEVYRKGEAVVALRKGEWKLQERDAGRRVRGTMSIAALRAVRLPHEELAGLPTWVTGFRKLEEKEGDQTVYVGDFTEEAAKAFIAANSERRDEGTPGGTGRFWITPAGEIAMVEIIARIKKSKGKDTGVSMWITMSELGAAKLEVPDAAAKALEEKKD